MTKFNKKTVLAVVSVFCVIMISACAGRGNQDTGNAIQNKNNGEGQIKNLDVTAGDVRVPLLEQSGQMYFPMDELVQAIDYKMEWDPSTQLISIGDVDAFYELSINSTQAKKEEEPVSLTVPPILMNDRVYAPVEALTKLFDQDLHYNINGNELTIHPIVQDDVTMDEMESDEQPAPADEPFFQDDPEDPNKGEEDDSNEVWSSLNGEQAIPAAKPLKNINMNALIREAKKYMGVPYKFGAKHYSKSRKFDCSSYAQYVYGKFNVKLRRVSRNQAKQGHYVSRKKLRKGDLVFFSVPGRFKSNKTVGHVGIYIGNGKMINTFSNKKGVHITYINKGYWSRKYLKARRVAY